MSQDLTESGCMRGPTIQEGTSHAKGKPLEKKKKKKKKKRKRRQSQRDGMKLSGRRWEPNIVADPLLRNLNPAKEGNDDGSREGDNNMEGEKEERILTTKLNESQNPSTLVVSDTSLNATSRSERTEPSEKMIWEPPDDKIHLKMSHGHSVPQE